MNPVLIGGLFLASVFSYLGVSRIEMQQTFVSPIVDVVPEATTTILSTIEITPTATPTASPTPKKVESTAAPKPTPTKELFENVSGLLDKYSSLYSLDVNVVRHLALCESGLSSNATNGRYVGLFQYDSQTWKKIRSEMGLDTDPNLRYSAEESIRATTYALSQGKSKLWPNCVP